MNPLQWKLKTFQKLTTEEFHNILQLRIDVFVVEQNCPYPELDGKDKFALHFFTVEEKAQDKIIAYTRIFKPGDYYRQAAIGRVVVDSHFRKQSLGHELMRRSIEQVKILFHTTEIKIGAQTYLKEFYQQHGFIQTGESYLEDGIPHIHMIRK
jgi:ElaA protein